jgi:proteic killer suppression protein
VYNACVIVSFGDKTTEDIYNGLKTKTARKVPKELWNRIPMKLDILNACIRLEDLRSPPSNRIEKLSGDLMSFYSIRVNDQYRIVFHFANGNCVDVCCTDYH